MPVNSNLLSPDIITNEALSVLHQKANFIGSINKQYDDQFAKTGAKIGETLKIRMPNQFEVRTGRTLDVQDVSEESQTLTVSTRAGVDINFSSQDLTLTIDKFSERYIQPAVSRLAAYLESQAMTMYKDVYQSVWDSAGDFTARKVLDGISMRIVRAYDINNDNLPCRIDVHYGFKTLRPEWARLNAKNGRTANSGNGPTPPRTAGKATTVR